MRHVQITRHRIAVCAAVSIAALAGLTTSSQPQLDFVIRVHAQSAGPVRPTHQSLVIANVRVFDEQDRNAAAAELDGGDEATGAAADNQHIDVADARHGRSVAATIGVRSVPSRFTSTSTTSPGVRYQGGLRT